VSCPAGSQPLGGGALTRSVSTAVSLNSTDPVNGGRWQVWVNNASTTDTTFVVSVNCGRLPGYVVVTGSRVVAAPGTQTFAQAVCPGGEQPVGGGVFDGATGTVGAINSTFPTVGAWKSYVNNNGVFPTDLVPVAICAGA
jgi:hypothetical protein